MLDDGSSLAPVMICITLAGSLVMAGVLLCMFKGERGKRALKLFGVSVAALLAFAVYSYSRSCGSDVVGRAGEADHASCAIGAFTSAPFIVIGAAIAAVIVLGVWERVKEVMSKRRG